MRSRARCRAIRLSRERAYPRGRMVLPLPRGRIRAMRTASVQINAPSGQAFSEILTPEALDFLARLHHEVEPVRVGLLQKRAEIAEHLRSGGKIGRAHV